MLKQTRIQQRAAFRRDATPAVAAGFRRSMVAQARQGTMEDEDGLIWCAISSEAPYERWFGIEILSHTPDAVDLTRLADGRHPFLVGHDMEHQVGVVRKCELDTEARMLRGGIKFSRAQHAQDIKQDVLDDVRPLVSVGYFVEEVQEMKRNDDGTLAAVRTLSGDEFRRDMESKFGADYYRAGQAAARAAGEEPTVYLVTRWQPFEASSVPVPADVTVGFDRSAGAGPAPKPATPPAPAPSSFPPVEIITMTEAVRTPEAIELDRVRNILALAEQYALYLQANDAQEAIRNGRSLEQFTKHVMERMQSKHSTPSGHVEIGMSRAEAGRYSFGRALVAAITGDWSKAGLERECSQAVSRMLGSTPEGFYVPGEALSRDFNVGTSSEAGNLVATELRSDMLVDALRNKLVLNRLGATFLSGLTGNVDLPRISTDVTVGMVTEIGSASETNPNTTKYTLSPKRISAYTEVSRQALIQAAMPLENMIRDLLLKGAAVKLEDQIFNGAGTGAEIRGLRNTTGVGTVAAGSNGAAPAWSHYVDLESACANNNAEPDTVAGYVVNTKTRGKLKQTQQGTNLPFIWQPGQQQLNGYRAEVTNAMPSNLTKGTSTTVCSANLFSSDWSYTTIGLFGAPDITVNPYTKDDTGQVKIVLHQFADMQCRLPASVAKIEDLLAG